MSTTSKAALTGPRIPMTKSKKELEKLLAMIAPSGVRKHLERGQKD
jgi:hypothetical protein